MNLPNLGDQEAASESASVELSVVYSKAPPTYPYSLPFGRRGFQDRLNLREVARI